LVKWQKVHRIVGSADPMWIVEHLFLDSLLFLTLLPPSLRTLVDLGSGAGLPGLPIKIVSRELEITLVESRRRRAAFLSSAVRELKLERAHVVEGRIENLLGELEGRFEGVVMRCAGDVSELIPLAARLVESHGVVVAAGPPRPTPLALGEWVTVPGVKPGTTRRFAIYRRP
jgi:16S rRNA (guanine527-N7)-methyltransferase